MPGSGAAPPGGMGQFGGGGMGSGFPPGSAFRFGDAGGGGLQSPLAPPGSEGMPSLTFGGANSGNMLSNPPPGIGPSTGANGNMVIGSAPGPGQGNPPSGAGTTMIPQTPTLPGAGGPLDWGSPGLWESSSPFSPGQGSGMTLFGGGQQNQMMQALINALRGGGGNPMAGDAGPLMFGGG